MRNVPMIVAGYTFSIGNNVSQVTRMTDFIFWCTMRQAVWVKMWPCKIKICILSDGTYVCSMLNNKMVQLIFASIIE